MASHPNWQESLNSKLIERLVRPLVQPGVISPKIAQSIVRRSQRFANRLPMLAIADRGYATTNSKVEPVPIVYAQAQRVLANSISTNLESNSQPLVSGESRASQSGEGRSSSQPFVVQAKFASPSSPASLPTNLPINASERLTGLTDTLPSQAKNLPFIALGSPPTNAPDQLLPIVPAQNLNFKTGFKARMASNLSQVDTTPTDTSEPTIVQAKFVSPNTPPNLDGEGGSQNLTGFLNIKLLANAEDLTPQPPSLRGKGEGESPFLKGKRESESPSSKIRRVGEGSQLIDRQEIPIVYLHSKQAEEVNSQINYSTTNAIAATPSSTILSTISSISRSQPLPKVYGIPATLNPLSELQEPLVFTQPPVTPQSAAKPAAQTDESSYLSNPALGESSNSPVSNSQVSNSNFSHSIQSETHSNQPVNIDELADKIERKLMRKLIVENERRGRKSWS